MNVFLRTIILFNIVIMTSCGITNKNARFLSSLIEDSKFKDSDIGLTCSSQILSGINHYVKLDVNLPLTDQLIYENTIYEISYDFLLNGKVISLPQRCVLYFKGGSIQDGQINVDNAYIKDGTFIECGINSKGSLYIDNTIIRISRYNPKVKNCCVLLESPKRDVVVVVRRSTISNYSASRVNRVYTAGIKIISDKCVSYYISNNIIDTNNISVETQGGDNNKEGVIANNTISANGNYGLGVSIVGGTRKCLLRDNYISASGICIESERNMLAINNECCDVSEDNDIGYGFEVSNTESRNIYFVANVFHNKCRLHLAKEVNIIGNKFYKPALIEASNCMLYDNEFYLEMSSGFNITNGCNNIIENNLFDIKMFVEHPAHGKFALFSVNDYTSKPISKNNLFLNNIYNIETLGHNQRKSLSSIGILELSQVPDSKARYTNREEGTLLTNKPTNTLRCSDYIPDDKKKIFTFMDDEIKWNGSNWYLDEH